MSTDATIAAGPSGSADPLVSLRSLRCDLGHGPVLDRIDLDIAPDDFIGIVGPSGAGKTTLLRAILGSVTPAAGSVQRRRGLRIGYVPQVETIDWTFPATVTEVVAMARPGRPWISRRERAEIVELLDRLGLAGLADRHIRALSGGQQQRVFVARALIGAPDLLLLDEPTSGVDVRTRHELLHLLADLHRTGRAIVLSTHDLNGVATHLPRIVCLNTAIAAEGAPVDVLRPDVLEATFGAPFDVLVHAGLPVVVDRHDPRTHPDHTHPGHTHLGHAHPDDSRAHPSPAGPAEAAP